MKRKKNFPDRLSRDKYQDGPRKPAKMKPPRYADDDEDWDDAFNEWQDMKRWNEESGGWEDDPEEE